jgi:hypothetical protein
MSISKRDYRPVKREAITHNGYHTYDESGYTLRCLAEKAYAALLPSERMSLDLRCDHLVAQLRKITVHPFGLQSQSLRELVLAVYMVKTYQGSNMTEIMHSAIMGRRRVETVDSVEFLSMFPHAKVTA